ncbi:hypothetical protein DFH28DRAFT_1123873 [Melampsora americana]|nr:hypothetical protein DFH28DRAFT_1123873 [Melampsora americana]
MPSDASEASETHLALIHGYVPRIRYTSSSVRGRVFRVHEVRASLMGRFVRDCEIALEVCDSSKDHKDQGMIEETNKVENSTKSTPTKKVEETSKGKSKAKAKLSIEPEALGNNSGNSNIDHPVVTNQQDDTQDYHSDKHQDNPYQPDSQDQAESPLTSPSQGDNPSPDTIGTRQMAYPNKSPHSDSLNELGRQTRKSVRVTSQTLDNKDQPESKRLKRSEVLKNSEAIQKKAEPFSFQNISSMAKEKLEKQKKQKEEKLLNAKPEDRVLIVGISA